MANFCRNCGTKLNPGAKFCPNCGRPVSAAPLQNNRNTGVQTSVKKARGSGTHNLFNIILAIVMMVEAVLVCFWQPGLLRSKPGAIPGITVEESTAEEIINESGGHSDPLDITPIKGMRIIAEENALDKNREFKVRPATEEEMEKAAGCLDDHALLVAAFDVDAGLGAEDYFPGTYEVELDMETVGIPESLADQVMVVRIDENGDMFPYVTECEGGKIHYSSKQNSVTAVIVGTAAIATLIGVPVYVENYDYKYYSGKTRTGIGNRHFILEWAVEDFSPFGEFSERSVELDKALTIRSRELYEEVLEAIPTEMYRTTSNGQVIPTAQADAARKKDVLSTWKGQCDRDPEYQQLKNDLAESYPPVIKELYRSAELAWDYLTGPEQGAKMPSYQVEILLKRKLEDREADTHKLLYKGITVNLGFEELLYPGGASAAGPVAYNRMGMENLLLTMVHELFHVSQFMYYSSAFGAAYTSNARLFEAQANVVEAQAFTSFMKKGLLPACAKAGLTVEDETQKKSNVLTLWNQWEYMAVPLDKLPENKSQVNDAGYNEANYLEYMCKNHGNITMGKMMESFSGGQSFSRTVALAWGMTNKEQEESYDKFLQELRDGKLPPSKVNTSIYAANEIMSLSSDLYFHRNDMVYADAPNLCFNRIQIGLPQDTEYALVAAGLDTGHSGNPSGTGKTDSGLYEIRFAFDNPEENKTVEADLEHNILFQPVRKLSNPQERLVYITELLRVPNGRKPGFEFCVMLAPEKPEVKPADNGKKLEVKLPEMKQDKFLAMKSIMSAAEEMGVLMTLEREDGVLFEARFKPQEIGKTTELDIKPYLENWKEKELPEFQYTIQEYFRIGGVDYTGPRSAQAEKDEPITAEDITPFLGEWKVMFLKGVSDYHYILTKSSFRRFILDYDENEIINDRTFEIFSYDVKDNTLNLIYLDTVGNGERGELHLRIIDEDHLESLDSKNVWTRVTND